MNKHLPFRFLAVVEQPRNFNYSVSPRAVTTTDVKGSVPSRRSRKTTLDSLQRRVTGRLSDYLPDGGGRLLIWLLDDEGVPTLFITGLLDLREGKVTERELAEWSEQLLPHVTCEQTMTEVEVTINATAELTFDDGYDFNSSDYDGDGNDRDNEIARVMVDEFCGHLAASHVSYVERVEDYLMVNADVTETVSVNVPWKMNKRLRKDQLAYLKKEAVDELSLLFDVCDRFVNVSVTPVPVGRLQRT